MHILRPVKDLGLKFDLHQSSILWINNFLSPDCFDLVWNSLLSLDNQILIASHKCNGEAMTTLLSAVICVVKGQACILGGCQNGSENTAALGGVG